MQLLGRDANLGPKSELTTIGKASGGIYVYGTGVNAPLELMGSLPILGYDRFRVGRNHPDNQLTLLKYNKFQHRHAKQPAA